MDSREKTKDRDKSKETGSDFPFGDCQEMIEKMKECCGGMAGTVDCCFMMGKMKDKKRGTSERE